MRKPVLCYGKIRCEAVLSLEPCCEKTDFRGFRPGPTQTRLYNHTRWFKRLEISYLGSREIVLAIERKQRR